MGIITLGLVVEGVLDKFVVPTLFIYLSARSPWVQLPAGGG